jgi:steroid delta-isomerase-like uncharacterized protein
MTELTEPASAPHAVGASAAGRSRAEQAVADFFDAFGRRDVRAISQLLTDDVVEELPGTPPIEGIEAECAFLTGLFAAFPDMHVEVTRLMAVDQVVAAAWTRRGTFGGKDFQGLPANGATIDSAAAGFFEIKGGLIARITVCADMNKFGLDLGVVPPEGSVAHRLALGTFRARVRVQRVLRAVARGNRVVR